MTLERDEYTFLDQFIYENENSKIADSALHAFFDVLDVGEEMADYVVINVHGIDALAKITDAWLPIRISPYVKPFDEEKIYPLQKVKKKIDWD